MYQIFYDRAGNKKHTINVFSPIQYWNDACWHRSIPENTSGLTYLDVGSHAGLCCLRFEQRGGEAVGLDFNFSDIIVDGVAECKTSFPTVGQESTNEEYLWTKNEYDSKYKVYSGGFHQKAIVPDLGKFNVVSCLNVIEYLSNPRECIEAMFARAKDRVILAVDVVAGESYPVSDLRPMKWVVGVRDALAWMPWPTVHWIYDIGMEGHSRYQGFFVSTNPNSLLKPVDPSPVDFDKDCSISETEKFYQIRSK